MQEHDHEKLSLLIDDELDRAQARGLLKTIKQDAELQTKLRRYALISQAIKSEQCSVADMDFAAKVRQQVAAEPAYFLPRNKRNDGLKKAGLATAASIVLAVVWLTADESRKEVVAPQANLDMIAQRSAEAEQANAQFKEYLQAHNHVWYVNNPVGAQAYARVASYQQK